MTIANWAALRALLTTKVHMTGVVVRDPSTASTAIERIGQSMLQGTGAPGGVAFTAPTTAVALSYTGSAGAYSIRHPAASGTLGMVRAQFGILDTNALPSVLLIDRLSHQGGLSGVITTAQTTNLPTAALTRYTSGAGVWGFIQVYTSLGATDTTMSVSYTNQSGTSGRTGTVQTMANTPTSQNVYPIAFQDGDTGMRSIESVTLSASTGTAGNFGVVLAKPLAMIPPRFDSDITNILGWNNGIDSEAFLDVIHMARGTNAAFTPPMRFGFAEV